MQKIYHLEKCCGTERLKIIVLTGICVNNVYQRYIISWHVVNLFQPWLEVNVCIMHFIYDVNEIFTGLFPFALEELQDFAHLKNNQKKKYYIGFNFAYVLLYFQVFNHLIFYRSDTAFALHYAFDCSN